MKYTIFTFTVLLSVLNIVGCGSPSVPGSPGVPEPMKVLENPATRERVRFFREIPYKAPKDYDENKHLAEWMAKHQKNGFTTEITREADCEQLAELRRKILQQGGHSHRPTDLNEAWSYGRQRNAQSERRFRAELEI